MKIKRNGSIKLQPNETQVDNFIFTKNRDSVSVQDINGLVKLEIKNDLPLGIMVRKALEDGDKQKYLLSVAMVDFFFHSTIVDGKLLEDMLKALNKGVERHKKLYKDNLTEEEEKEVVEEVKTIHEEINTISQ